MDATDGKSEKVVQISIDALVDVQSRIKTDEAHVAYLVDLINEGVKLDPLSVYRDSQDGTHWVSDGHHRRLAHKRTGRTHVDCVLRPGGKFVAIVNGIKSNGQHKGKPLTRADRRHGIAVALKANPACPDSTLGSMLGVDGKTIASVRMELVGKSEIPNCSRLASDGRQFRPRAHAADNSSNIQSPKEVTPVPTPEIPEPQAGGTPAARVCASDSGTGSESAPTCSCGSPMVKSAGALLCRTCDFAPGDPEYLPRKTATTSETERPLRKPIGQLLGDAIADFGRFARTLDELRRYDVDRFKGIRKGADEISAKLDAWNKEATR